MTEQEHDLLFGNLNYIGTCLAKAELLDIPVTLEDLKCREPLKPLLTNKGLATVALPPYLECFKLEGTHYWDYYKLNKILVSLNPELAFTRADIRSLIKEHGLRKQRVEKPEPEPEPEQPIPGLEI